MKYCHQIQVPASIEQEAEFHLESNEVGKRPMGVTRLGEKFVFRHDPAGKVLAAVDRSPHRGVALSAGVIEPEHLQCPFVHLPFIHRNTIGRGNRTLVDGPIVE